MLDYGYEVVFEAMKMKVITKVEFKLEKTLDLELKICPTVSKAVDK